MSLHYFVNPGIVFVITSEKEQSKCLAKGRNTVMTLNSKNGTEAPELSIVTGGDSSLCCQKHGSAFEVPPTGGHVCRQCIEETSRGVSVAGVCSNLEKKLGPSEYTQLKDWARAAARLTGLDEDVRVVRAIAIYAQVTGNSFMKALREICQSGSAQAILSS